MLRDIAFTSTGVQTGLPEPYVMIHVFERAPGYMLDRHSHNEAWHINLVMDGAVEIATEEQQITVYKNQLFIVPAMLPHKITSSGGYKQAGVDIICREDDRRIGQLVQTYFGQKVAVVGVNSPFDSFDQVAELLKNPLPFHIARVINLMERIILDAVETKMREEKSFSMKLAGIIAENNPYTLTLKDICRLTNYSKTQVERLARQELKCGITAYLNNIKINAICVLLRETNLGSARIAERVGLYDASHLTTFFKRHTGVTPGEYRRNLRKE